MIVQVAVDVGGGSGGGGGEIDALWGFADGGDIAVVWRDADGAVVVLERVKLVDTCVGSESGVGIRLRKYHGRGTTQEGEKGGRFHYFDA